MANILGLAVARHRALERIGINIREDGSRTRDPQGRSSIDLLWLDRGAWRAEKAVELLGMGKASLRLIPVDEE